MLVLGSVIFAEWIFSDLQVDQGFALSKDGKRRGC